MVKLKLNVLLAERYMKMAELTRLTGINRGSMFRLYHNTATSITFEQIEKICSVLEVTPNELFGWESKS